jgi:hypothetical protein
MTNGAAVLPPVKSDVRVPTGSVGEWSADDSNELRQAALDLRSQAILETQERVAADAAIIASGATPANVGLAPITPTGSSTTKSVNDWLSSLNGMISVLEHGADRTGVADSTTAIQAAVDAAALAGKIVYAPAGIYSTNTISLPAKCSIVGDGIGVTTFTQRLTVAGAYGYFQVFYADPGAGSQLGNIHLRDFTVSGDVVGLGFYEQNMLVMFRGVKDALVERVEFKGFRGDGLYVGRSTAHNTNVQVRDCIFDGVNSDNRNGISVIDCDGMIVTGCTFRNCSRSNMPGPFDVEPDDADDVCRAITVADNLFVDCGGSAGSVAIVIRPLSPTVPYQDFIVSGNIVRNCNNGVLVYGKLHATYVTGPTETSTKNNVQITDNILDVLNYGFRVECISQIRIAGNYIKCAMDNELAYEFGYDTAGRNVLDAKIENNLFDRCGSGSAAVGLTVGGGTRIGFHGNTFLDCGKGDAFSYAVFFRTQTSADVDFINNRFDSPQGKTTWAIQKNGDHTFTEASNRSIDNVLNGLSNAFVSANGPKSWTPAVYGATIAGAPTHTVQQGRLERIGNRVFIDLTVVWTALNSASGPLRINIPVAVGASAPSYSNLVLDPIAPALMNAGATNRLCAFARVDKTNGCIIIESLTSVYTRSYIVVVADCSLSISGSYEVDPL